MDKEPNQEGYNQITVLPSVSRSHAELVCWASRFVRSFPSSTIAERPKIPSPMSFARRSLSLADAAVALSLSVLLSAHPVCHSLEGSRQIPDQISRFYCGGYSWGFGIVSVREEVARDL